MRTSPGKVGFTQQTGKQFALSVCLKIIYERLFISVDACYCNCHVYGAALMETVVLRVFFIQRIKDTKMQATMVWTRQAVQKMDRQCLRRLAAKRCTTGSGIVSKTDRVERYWFVQSHHRQPVGEYSGIKKKRELNMVKSSHNNCY